MVAVIRGAGQILRGQRPPIRVRRHVPMQAVYQINQTVTMRVVLPNHNLEVVASAVERLFGVDRIGMLSMSRIQKFSHPRQVLYYLLHEVVGWSYSGIGRRLKRDHSTVMWGVAAVRKRRLIDSRLDYQVMYLIDSLKVPNGGAKHQ